MQDGGAFNSDYDVMVGSASFASGVATIDIATVTVSQGATTQLFLVYEVSPSAVGGNTAGAGVTNSSYFRMSSPNTTVSGSFPFSRGPRTDSRWAVSGCTPSAR